MTVIQLPEWKGWRIAGNDKEWQIQRLHSVNDDGVERWMPTNFYPALEHAVGYAYERTLRESPKKAVDIREVRDECERVKARLVKAVRKAVER